MSITPQFKEELRQRVRLSDVIGKKVKLTRAGVEFKGCCPFHHEKTPSFTVNDQKQFYHCFGCGAHGDVITFVMEMGNLPFMEAIETLAAQAGMQVPKPTPQEQEKYKKFDRLLKCSQEAAKWFMDKLHDPRNKEVKNYALERGLSEDIMKSFRIGYAPGEMEGLTAHLAGLGFTDQEMVEASLARKSKKGGGIYGFFRDRLMFPVTDGRGRIVAFGGRILPDHLKKPETGDYTPAKYMNSSDTILFHKGRMVFNESIARAAAGKGAPVFIAEGYMDVIALVQAGFHGAVAPLGTALTEDQIRLVWSMIPDEIKEPYICFDGDEAGRRAAMRAIDRMLPMLGPGLSARFVFMPAGEDPDSLIKAGGKKAFDRCLAEAKPMIDVVWQNLVEGKSFDTPERLASLEKSIQNICDFIPDSSVQYHYRSKLREKMRTEFSSFKQQRNQRYHGKNTRRTGQDVVEMQGVAKGGTGHLKNLQAAFCYTLYLFPRFIEQYEEVLAMLNLDEADIAMLRDALLECYEQSSETPVTDDVQQVLADGDVATACKNMAQMHIAFLSGQDDLQIVEKGLKELLQNMRRHANFDGRSGKRLRANAQALLGE